MKFSFWSFLKRFRRIGKKAAEKRKIRRVIFGISIRYLGFLILAMFFIISALTYIMYVNQIRLLNEEKKEKAGVLVQILSGPAEYYMDNSSKTTPEEMEVKFKIIGDEIAHFKKYNDDIVKILLTDDRGIVVYSTYPGELRDKIKTHFITNCLVQKDEKLVFYDYKQKTKDNKKHSFRAITYPIFLQGGLIIDVLKDYKKSFHKYHTASRETKAAIYQTLWKKYQANLGPDFKFPPKKNPKKGEVVKAGDVDFLFLSLFSSFISERNRRIRSGEAWLWKGNWLNDLKTIKYKAYENDNSAGAKKADDEIIEKMEYLAAQVDQMRRLGALAIIFDVDRINKEFDQNISTAIEVALAILIISAILFFFVTRLIVKNLKDLEKWAMTVSEGNIDIKADIKSRDEIGRIADIFNLMLDELKAKFHLEKYVSNSTRTMIEKAKECDAPPELGKTERKNLAFLFSDVRGFTSFSEKNDPELVIEVLNLYLDLQAKIVSAKKGDIDDYVGDQIMAHFNGRNRADIAVETAKEIMMEIGKLNNERRNAGQPYFEVGIGVHGGDVVVGNIGSGFRMDFTCLGDTVNTASRLCSNAKAGEILISEELYRQCKKEHKAVKIEPLQVKGKAEALKVMLIKQ